VVGVNLLFVDIGSCLCLTIANQFLDSPHSLHQLFIQSIFLDLAQLIRQINHLHFYQT